MTDYIRAVIYINDTERRIALLEAKHRTGLPIYMFFVYCMRFATCTFASLCTHADKKLRANVIGYFEDQQTKQVARRAIRKCTTAHSALQSLLRHIHSFSRRGQGELLALLVFYRTATNQRNDLSLEFAPHTDEQVEYAFRHAECPETAKLCSLPKSRHVGAQLVDVESEYANWLKAAADPEDEQSIKLAKILLAYDVDIDQPCISPHGQQLMMMLSNPGCMQFIVDHYLSEARRQNVWTLVRSWGIRCSLQRLELMKEDVMRAFKHHYVHTGINNDSRVFFIPAMIAVLGDIEEIELSWPIGEVPAFSSLNPDRFHISTLVDICVQQDVDRFELLIDAMFGEWRSKNVHLVAPSPQTSNDDSIRKRVLLAMATRKREQEMNVAEMQRLSAMGKLKKHLAKLNEHIDDELCAVCMDETVAIRFEPCGHQICCKACAKSLQNCCICRATVLDRKQAVFVPSEQEEEKEEEEESAAIDDTPSDLTSDEFFEAFCYAVNIENPKALLKNRKKKMREVAEIEARKNGQSCNHKQYKKKKNRRNRK